MNGEVSVREAMDRLVKRIRERLDVELRVSPERAHHRVCSTVADEFELWDAEDRFPMWLSVLVGAELVEWEDGEADAEGNANA